QWVDEHSIEWRRSHIRSLLSTLNGRLVPHFGDKAVGSITKSDILAFRAILAKVKGRGEKEGLSPKRINEIIGLLRQILTEAADRFQFTSPALNIKTLRLRKTDVAPFSLVDVQRILGTVRADYKDYFTVRFFTGMRTGEVHGLKWKYVDFDLRILRVRETFVLGEDEYTKTDGSQRDIQMSQPVYDALQRQQAATDKVSDYVFCNLQGQPLDNKNFSDRIWYPLLRHLDLEKRRPYQMRHTAATLWLASGEAPEWIARQLGHTSTEMLFRVYSRYVPNLTRQDGSAMERLLASQLSQGALLQQKIPGNGATIYVPAQDITPQPIPKLRGMHSHKSVTKDDHIDQSIREVGSNHESVGGPSRAQPPPMSWLAQSAAWMPNHPPLH
ncbi:MAG: site-specific integrase, partial [Burkholderiaceae bacterium]|nr:site-specific integrase [Burkholderiaceae bacterium]